MKENNMPLKTDIKNKSSKLSSSNDKRGEMLIKIDELMEKINSNYGPFILDELQKRLEFTIQEFNDDLKIVLETTFNKHNNLNKEEQSSLSNDEIPSFIAEHQKKRQKK